MYHPQRKNLNNEETYDEKTAEKEIPSPWIGAPVEMTRVGQEGRWGGVWSILVTTLSSVYRCCAQRALCLFLQGLESH